MQPTPEDSSDIKRFAPLVKKWTHMIDASKKSKADFQAVADQCRVFFSGMGDGIWDKKYQEKFGFKIKAKPTFKANINKAFELVALVGPVLYWHNPVRECRSRQTMQFSPEVFGNVQDPAFMHQFQVMMAEEQHRTNVAKTRTQVMEQYLNYTPGEQPFGGLKGASQMAITEALVCGRGTLWVEDYELPGSDKRLTGAFFDTVDNLFIDPDAETLQDAMWIARKHIKPVWQVERDFNLPKGSLKGKDGTYRSTELQAETADRFKDELNDGTKEQDLIVYYDIYSKMGIGTRLDDAKRPTVDAIDELVGDYAYIAMSPGVDFFLNAHQDHIERGGEDGGPMEIEDVLEMFDWPVPLWKDNLWPCCMLDFYNNPSSVWPIPPLAPGIGELYLINIITANLTDQVFENSKNIIAVLKTHEEELRSTLEKGGGIVTISEAAARPINEMIQFLQKPGVNRDAWELVDRLMAQFEKRVGLNEMLYGLNSGGISRTASDAKFKQSQSQIRGDHMASQVEDWMETVARTERLVARWTIEGSDLEPLLGKAGAAFWQKYIESSDVDEFMREMTTTITAGSARKPNKDRDNTNMNAVLPILSQEFSKHADMTTDTTPLNNLFSMWGKAIDMDTSPLQLSPRTPPQPSPEQMQAQQEAQQQAQQFEQAKMEAEITKKELEVEGKRIEVEGKKVDVVAKETGVDKDRQKLEYDHLRHLQIHQQSEQRHNQNMAQDEERHMQELQQKDDMAVQKLETMQAANVLKNRPPDRLRSVVSEIPYRKQ